MYRRDLLTAEIQRLAQALSRLMGLKQEGKLEEAGTGATAMLEKEFGIIYTDLAAGRTSAFSVFLEQQGLDAEKLDILSQLLYLKFSLEMNDAFRHSLAEKLLVIYDRLENRHKVINMNSISRQKTLKQFLQ